MMKPVQTDAPIRHGGPAAVLARLAAGIPANVWGGLCFGAAYLAFAHGVDFLADLSRGDRALWSLVQAVFWGACLSALVWAFRFKYRAERRARLAQAGGPVADPAPGPPPAEQPGRTFTYLGLHGVWALLAASGGLYFLSTAGSNAEINVWGARVGAVMGIGLLGSLVIQVAWMGRARWATVRFWVIWYAVVLLCCAVAVPLALALVPL